MVKRIIDHPVTKTTGKVLQIKLQVILFLLLPFVVFTFVTSRTEIMRGLQSFVVVSGSMQPTLPVGSVIYTKKEIGYKVGDIIAFKNAADQTVTHRIANIDYKDSTFYVTKGDANKVEDSKEIPAGSVLGKVYFHVPYVGYFMSFLKTPKGFILVIIVPVILFILSELWNIKIEMERQIEKRMLEKFQQQRLNMSS